MENNDFSQNEEIERLISLLNKMEERNPKLASVGRARFLARAKTLNQTVSAENEIRQTGHISQFFERIWIEMKPKLKYSVLVVAAILLVVGIVMVNNVTTVSAQQILDRASAAQSTASGQGISHTRYEVYENPGAVTGEQVGRTTYIDNTYDVTGGKFRVIVEDIQGKIIEISSSDNNYYYSTNGTTSGSPLMVYRTPQKYDPYKEKPRFDPDATTTTIYDQFNNNPRVKVEGKVTRPDGRQAYVLINQNEQVQKTPSGQEAKTITGTTRMIFDAGNYSLLEERITLRKNGKDIILYELKTLSDEIIPDNSKIAWDLSDLRGIKIVDEREPATNEEPVFETLTPGELAGRAEAYILKTVPEGFTQKIVAVSNQPEFEHYQFEVNYEGKDNAFFGLQFVGKIDESFAETNFYDGSYKTASGLVMYFSPSGSSAMMISPTGNGYLVGFTMPREEAEKLVEDLILLK
jgi:hypothetical protein